VLLNGGKVLILEANAAELYDPVSSTFSMTGSPVLSDNNGFAVLLTNGEVLVAGGFYGGPFELSLATAELYNPAAGTFSIIGSRHPAAIALTPYGWTMERFW